MVRNHISAGCAVSRQEDGKMDVLCFGEPLVGFYPLTGKSLVDDVPIIKTWGGDTSNVVIGISRLGGKSAYLTKVGDDIFGRGFMSLWSDNGVNTSLVEYDKKRNTGLYFVSFENNRHVLTYYRANSAASAITEDVVTDDMLNSISILHLSGISVGMSKSALMTGRALIVKAKALGKTVSFDVNYRSAQWANADEASRVIGELIRLGVDILEITDDEMLALGWGEDPDVLLKMFPDVNIITFKQGAKGATILTKDSSFRVHACKIDVKDTVGAGDSFDAGFLISLLEGKTLVEAARFATVAAAHTCTGTGPLEKMPTRADVERLWKELKYEG